MDDILFNLEARSCFGDPYFRVEIEGVSGMSFFVVSADTLTEGDLID